jgi:hypothetical protein
LCFGSLLQILGESATVFSGLRTLVIWAPRNPISGTGCRDRCGAKQEGEDRRNLARLIGGILGGSDDGASAIEIECLHSLRTARDRSDRKNIRY